MLKCVCRKRGGERILKLKLSNSSALCTIRFLLYSFKTVDVSFPFFCVCCENIVHCKMCQIKLDCIKIAVQRSCFL